MQSKQLSASVREKGQMKQLLVIFGAYNMRHLEQDYYLGFFFFFRLDRSRHGNIVFPEYKVT